MDLASTVTRNGRRPYTLGPKSECKRKVVRFVNDYNSLLKDRPKRPKLNLDRGMANSSDMLLKVRQEAFAILGSTFKDLRPALVFCHRRCHADLLAEQLSSQLGVPVPVVDSTMSVPDRDTLAQRLRDSDAQLPVVVALPVWSTGINIPSIKLVALVGRHSAPIGLIQEMGRGSRPADGKYSFTLLSVETEGDADHGDRRAARLAEEGIIAENTAFLDALYTKDWTAPRAAQNKPHRDGPRSRSRSERKSRQDSRVDALLYLPPLPAIPDIPARPTVAPSRWALAKAELLKPFDGPKFITRLQGPLVLCIIIGLIKSCCGS